MRRYPHETIGGRPEIDERGLTEEVARRKTERVVAKLGSTNAEVEG
jgi:hypothetical protein